MSDLHDFLINTGDNGVLSPHGIIATEKENLPNMAKHVRKYRHVILYAHGGGVGEQGAKETADRLFRKCQDRGLGIYFFIWESGLEDLFLGLFGLERTSKKKVSMTGKNKKISGLFDEISGSLKRQKIHFLDRVKDSEIVDRAEEWAGQLAKGSHLENIWGELIERAKGASKKTGGASLFVKELFKVMADTDTPGNKYKIHLVGHSAGSIYMSFLYQNVLKSILPEHENVTLASIQFMAPAIPIENARKRFEGAVAKNNFLVYTLSHKHEANELTGIKPNSVLRCVSDYCVAEYKGEEGGQDKKELLGIKKDFEDKKAYEFAKLITATKSVSHSKFQEDEHEIELILNNIAN